MKAVDKYYRLGRSHLFLTFFPYQIALGVSLGFFEGLRIRIYILCFKISINLSIPEIMQNKLSLSLAVNVVLLAVVMIMALTPLPESPHYYDGEGNELTYSEVDSIVKCHYVHCDDLTGGNIDPIQLVKSSVDHLNAIYPASNYRTSYRDTEYGILVEGYFCVRALMVARVIELDGYVIDQGRTQIVTYQIPKPSK